MVEELAQMGFRRGRRPHSSASGVFDQLLTGLLTQVYTRDLFARRPITFVYFDGSPITFVYFDGRPITFVYSLGLTGLLTEVYTWIIRFRDRLVVRGAFETLDRLFVTV